MDNKYNIEFTPESVEELRELDKQNQKRAFRTVRLFEELGKDGVNSRPLDNNGLFEMKSDKLRLYFMYWENSIVIVGLMTLKKTQKAPDRYKEIAHKRIDNYIKNRSK
jgi:phage-related protein